jgi:serine phosphatase RsbU (regulator of sigma subunit)
MLRPIINFSLKNYLHQPIEIQQKARIILNAALLTCFFSIVYAILYIGEGFVRGGILMFLVAIAFLLVSFLLRTNLSLTIIGNVYVFTCWIPACLLIYLTGGVNSGVLPWLSIMPLTANLLINQKYAFIWLVVSVLSGTFFGLWESLVAEIPIQYPSQFEIFNLTLSVVGLSAITILIVSIFDNSVKKAQKELEKQHSKILLINQDLSEKNQEVNTQNEELFQQQEEIISQRDYIEKKNQELELTNQKIKANETILRKALDRLKESEEKIKQQNQELAERNRLVNSSLNAAKTIQNAILPYQEKLDKLLNNYFVIYQPKDMVSGDFFWLNKVGDITILIVADCTGHGVPGAFMTLIGNTLLDKIVRVWNIVSPAEILTRLHEEVQIVLRQKETNNNNGMDMAIVSMQGIDNQQVKFTYSGAKIPVYYATENAIQVLKPNRKAIGGEQNDAKSFSNQEIILSKGSIIYMGSDGFVDQNDEKRIRFGEKRYKALLEKINNLSLSEQKTVLVDELENQLQNTTQRDDILVLGFRL